MGFLDQRRSDSFWPHLRLFRRIPAALAPRMGLVPAWGPNLLCRRSNFLLGNIRRPILPLYGRPSGGWRSTRYANPGRNIAMELPRLLVCQNLPYRSTRLVGSGGLRACAATPGGTRNSLCADLGNRAAADFFGISGFAAAAGVHPQDLDLHGNFCHP